MRKSLSDFDDRVKLQYAFMFLFGLTSIGFAFFPISLNLRMLGTTLFFGLTSGLWLSHLITKVYNTNTETTNSVTTNGDTK